MLYYGERERERATQCKVLTVGESFMTQANPTAPSLFEEERRRGNTEIYLCTYIYIYVYVNAKRFLMGFTFCCHLPFSFL